MTAIFGSIGLDEAVLPGMAALLAHRGGMTSIRAAGRMQLGGCFASTSNVAWSDGNLVAYTGTPFISDRSNKDSLLNAESISEYYHRFGMDLFNKINGHFTIAIWDNSHETLLLARDLFGTNTLFVSLQDSYFAFATEYKALLSIASIDRTIDRTAIQHFMKHGWAPSGQSFFKSIRPVLPGTVLALRGSEMTSMRLPPALAERPLPNEDIATETVREAVSNAIDLFAFDPDRRYGIMLSSGVDSAVIAAVVKRHLPRGELHTFTVGYGDDDPEIVGARQTSAAVGTHHHELIIQPQDLTALLPETVWTMEDPGGYDEFPCLYALHREACRHVDVIFSGNVCDTLFASMPAHRRIWNENHVPGAHFLLRKFDEAERDGKHPSSLLPRLLWRLTRGQAWPTPASVLGAPPLSIQSRGRCPSPLFEELRSDLARRDERMGAQEMLAARFGLSFRMPYAEKNLTELALRIPDRQKMNAFRGKRIFREAAKAFLPQEISRRPKRIQHLKYDRDMAAWLDERADQLLSPDRVRARGLFSTDSIRALRDAVRARSGKIAFQRLWNAITVEVWAEQFLDNDKFALSEPPVTANTSHSATVK